ncbi:MAG: ribosome assembly RNA-binding protein YhbY [Gammaproteobacteria bacterium HGW-Gammaproteobacteria-3]|nr:MAG: ribosome assembly RNA-binding protein YhbY [Gammaproteobacteria bacterium HGW-Gammaproteobacteria-3]
MKPAEKKQFKAQAHNLKPVIIIGQSGLTQGVLAEIEIALDCHELIKVKIRAEREQRNTLKEEICTRTHAELIQSIGQIIVIYRFNPSKNAITLSAGQKSPRKSDKRRRL